MNAKQGGRICKIYKEREKQEKKSRKERKICLPDSATPVYLEWTQKTSNPKDGIQDSKLPLVQEKYKVTAAAASTIQHDKEH